MEPQELHHRRTFTSASNTSSAPLDVSRFKLARDNTRLSAKQKINHGFDVARIRLENYQKRWSEIGQELPPQINRRHISVISIGGVIGTGLYIGTATALQHAGPLGTLLGYTITGTVVWSVVISIGEIVAFVPNVGGPVGLAGLYVDPALGFALGWNAWYNWSIILPTELSAAAILFNGFFPDASKADIQRSNLITITVLLILAIGINCFGSRAYGEAEFLFSCFKILTIVGLIITGIIIDLGGGSQGYIGFKNWRNPGPFVQYRGIDGSLGKFLGVWSSMIQAVFAFFGTEVPGVAAGEVQNPAKNIPRAVNRVWIRMQVTISSCPWLNRLFMDNLDFHRTLFYVLAVFVAGLLVGSDELAFPGSSNNGTSPGSLQVYTSPFVIGMQKADIKVLPRICIAAFVLSAFSAAVSDVYISSRFLYYLARCGHAPKFFAGIFRSEHNKTVIPWVGILVSASFAMLAYMSVSASTSAEEIFHWLSSLNTTAALLAWIGMLFTYLRWYQGTLAAEKREPNFKARHSEDIYRNRYRLQPWIAIYAFVMCVLVLIFNGWYVFTRRGPWRMAWEIGEGPLQPDSDIGNWVPTFVSSYLALPLFLLSVLGYKLIYRTRMVTLDEMRFDRGHIPEIHEEEPTTRWGKFLAVLF